MSRQVRPGRPQSGGQGGVTQFPSSTTSTGSLTLPSAPVSSRYPGYVLENLVETANTITATTESTAYPVANLRNRIKAQPFRFTSAGGDLFVEVDLGYSAIFDTIAIVGHDATDWTLTVKADNTPTPTSVISTMAYRTEDAWAPLSATVAQYVRFEFSATDLLSIGELIIGVRQTLPRPARWGIQKGIDSSGITHRTYGGVTWDYDLYANRYLRPGFRFPESEYQDFEDFSTAVGRRPFLWIPDISLTDCFYVKKQRGIAPEPVAPGRDNSDLALWYDWRINMEAESLGLTISA